MPWIRSGYCCRCGECCVGDPFPDKDALAQDDPMRRPAPVATHCPLFELRGNEGFCIGHIGAVPPGQEHPYYMSGCHLWPDHPDLIKDKPSCTYQFVWQD